MPEGDTIHRSARTLQRALAGKPVTRFASALARLAVQAEDAQLTGQVLSEVSAHGKHLCMRFASGVVLRSHMRMTGSWHIYRIGERWQRPRSQLRILLETADFQAVAFLVHEAELIGPRALERRVGALGPDVLGAQFDPAVAAQRLLQAGQAAICDALLDQRVLSGVGNVYKSELLFLARVHPARAAASLKPHEARALSERAAQLMRENARGEQDGIVTYHGLRRTTARADPGQRLWVYSRAGLPCRQCGSAIIVERMGRHARSTYYCPRCQPLMAANRAFGAA